MCEMWAQRDDNVYLPRCLTELSDMIRFFDQVVVIGRGLSQGDSIKGKTRISLEKLDNIHWDGSNHIIVEGAVDSGRIIEFLNRNWKSLIVSQASQVFSATGTFAVNAHGWDVKDCVYGETVDRIWYMDEHGDIQVADYGDVAFKNICGGFGQFGVVFKLKIRVTDNVVLFVRELEISSVALALKSCKDVEMSLIRIYGRKLVHQKFESTDQVMISNISTHSSFRVGLTKFALRIGKSLPVSMFNALYSLQLQGERRYFRNRQMIERNKLMTPIVDAVLYNPNVLLQEFFVDVDMADLLFGVYVEASEKFKILNASFRYVKKSDCSYFSSFKTDQAALVVCMLGTPEESVHLFRPIGQFVVESGGRINECYLNVYTDEILFQNQANKGIYIYPPSKFDNDYITKIKELCYMPFETSL